MKKISNEEVISTMLNHFKDTNSEYLFSIEYSYIEKLIYRSKIYKTILKNKNGCFISSLLLFELETIRLYKFNYK